ncbi:MAG: glycogen/starch synthase [Flavobacteriales bacterium]|nr:glycogen/starch synthase [Flavobacteriales bacterium]
MKKTRVLYITQEITPHLPETALSKISRYLPQGIQEEGKEIRTFMPKYGCINERRHQLHEVIRLSGMNLIIDDSDHPLIIKVASIQPARMQVYFIDNEEYFKRKAVFTDENGKEFEDNDERAIFFCRGVLETVRKLGWAPDIIHCHGWMTGLVPMYLKKSFDTDPIYADTKVIYSVYNDDTKESLNKDFAKKSLYDGVSAEDISMVNTPSYNNLQKLGAQYADAIIMGEETINEDLNTYITGLDKPILGCQPEETYIGEYSQFYDEILENAEMLVEQ